MVSFVCLSKSKVVLLSWLILVTNYLQACLSFSIIYLFSQKCLLLVSSWHLHVRTSDFKSHFRLHFCITWYHFDKPLVNYELQDLEGILKKTQFKILAERNRATSLVSLRVILNRSFLISRVLRDLRSLPTVL